MPNAIFLLLKRLRAPLIFLVCVYAVAVLGLVLIPGVDAQGNPWQMDFFHAFYFVSFMGSTIGFGEIPYPFTPAQRMWVTASIYFSVVSWLFAIGRLITTVQDPAFRQAVTLTGFRREVRRINEKFYLVCGFGHTGAMVVEALAKYGDRLVVIDLDQERLNALELTPLPSHVPALRADCTDPQTLIDAGMKHKDCAGVLALTCNDHANLKVAISSKLLNPKLPVFCRSEDHDVGVNMESFGTDKIINPFDLFADRLAMALHSPTSYIIHQWLTDPAGAPLHEPVFPPTGRYVLCGYGRFGKAVEQFLAFEGIEATIIEAQPEANQAPEGAIRGRGTEAVTLKEGGIEQAVGVIAGTDDDANNLSIVMTARELKPDLFLVARQNNQDNHAIFTAAELDVVMQRSDIIAREVVSAITIPELGEFLGQLTQIEDSEQLNVLASRISGVAGEINPEKWVVTASKARAPALAIRLFSGGTTRIRHLVSDPSDRERRLPCVALLLQRGDTKIVLPTEDEPLELGDRLLFCGQAQVERRMAWTVHNAKSLDYVVQDLTESPIGYRLWQSKSHN